MISTSNCPFSICTLESDVISTTLKDSTASSAVSSIIVMFKHSWTPFIDPEGKISITDVSGS